MICSKEMDYFPSYSKQMVGFMNHIPYTWILTAMIATSTAHSRNNKVVGSSHVTIINKQVEIGEKLLELHI